MKVTCSTGKVCYPTFFAAERENNRKIKLHGVKMDIYKCKWCNQYHLTGHTKRYNKEPYKREKWTQDDVKRLSRGSSESSS